MSHSSTMKNRLPLWSLVCLTLLLCGGVFLWYSTSRQQLLTQIDSQLNLAASYAELHPEAQAENSPCLQLKRLTSVSSALSEIAVFSPDGSFICSTTGNRQSSSGDIRPDAPGSHATPADIKDRHIRILSLPLHAGATSQGSLVFIAPYDREIGRLKLVAAVQIIAILVFVSLFTALQRCRRSKGLSLIQHLTRLMDATDADNQPGQLTLVEDADPEAKKLAASYNSLISRLTESLRRSRQFTADVTHELRTPLTILRGETELALRSSRNQEQTSQVLESNLEEISRMSYLIEDLLLLSKSDLGEIPLKMENLDLSGLVMELHHQSQLLAQSKNIGVDLDLPQEQIVIQADSLRLRQVLLNLLTNAIKYTPDGGNVTIDLKATQEHVEVAISDSGIGISQENLGKIFERFYRINKTRNRNDGGSGLGLAIVQWIVDAHDGKIEVQSKPGQGSCFTVKLPFSEKN